MMKELKPIDGWTSSQQKYKGRYRDENGDGLCGTWLREYKNTYEAVILSNGNSAGQYKYPKILKIPFKSKMVRWQNLYLCGGYNLIDRDGVSRMDENKSIIDAVCDGLKPVGFVITWNEEKLETYKRQVEKAGLPYDVTYEPEEEKENDDGWKYTLGGFYRMGVANHGTIGEVFDLANYAKTYLEFTRTIGYYSLEEGLEFVISKSHMKLSDLIINNGQGYGYFYAQPKTDGQLMFTGLTLGYPLESTFDRLFNW